MHHPDTTKVIVGISGGVDSSVAALLLKQQGYLVEGLFMKNWEEDDENGHCTAHTDLEDAQKVCTKLNIPLHTVNFSHEYWENVFQYFLDEYQRGRTPNPDILCNREIKFKVFLEHALKLGADFIATGHYVQVQQQNHNFQLLKGTDPNKDQSYFLHALDQYPLSKSLFPIGSYLKSDIRQIAENHHLITANKKDSTGICFIGERNFTTFLNRYLPAKPGNIITTEGECIGQHQGLMYHTLGQRKGLGIGGIKQKGEAPWYVIDKNLPDNTLIVGQGHDHPGLFCSHLETEHIHWINKTPELPLPCHAKIRYRQQDSECLVTQLSEHHFTITFKQPQRAATPGQSIVFYQNNICLGGATIERVKKNLLV